MAIWEKWIGDIELDNGSDLTGFLLGGNDLVTNVHALDYNDATNEAEWPGGTVYFDSRAYQVDLGGISYFDVPDLYGADGDNLIKYSNTQYDLAVISLEKSIGDRLGHFDWGYGPSYRSDYLKTAGYPAETFSGDDLQSEYVRVDYDTDFNVISHESDTVEGGSSGSPLWVNDSETGERFVVGVHSNGGSNAALFSEYTIDYIRDWIGDNNTPPSAFHDHERTAEGEPVTINVLANDSDPDGDTLNISAIASQPSRGEATLESGQIRYEPEPDFVGTDNFTYEVSDGNGGTDTATVTVDVAGGGSFPSTSEQRDLAKLYMATFDRAPDAQGFEFWANELETGASMLDVARSLFESSEGQEIYGDKGVEALVDTVYGNLLNRTPDTEGKDYWVGQLSDRAVSRAFSVEAVINGARANETARGQADAQLIQDKTDVAEYFVTLGLNDTDQARSILDQIEAGKSVEVVKADMDNSTSPQPSHQDDVSADEWSDLEGVLSDPFNATNLDDAKMGPPMTETVGTDSRLLADATDDGDLTSDDLGISTVGVSNTGDLADAVVT